MGKDKHTFTKLKEKLKVSKKISTLVDLKVKENYDKEIRQRMSEDVFAILHDESLQNDKYNQCWMSGFQYAFERIKTIFELKEKKNYEEMEN